MSPFDPAGPRKSTRRGGRRPRARAPTSFFLYVEGPRDHDILRVWARHISPALARSLEPCAVILGGRRPARAIEHFRGLGGSDAGVRGLVVLDRDHHSASDGLVASEPGLELFTWGRRHIESYVLVPDAIRRLLDRVADWPHSERLISDHLPSPDDEQACREINAKHLLGAKGPLARALGRALSPGEIARCMRAEELHADVLALYERIGAALGLSDFVCEVVRRLPSSQGLPDR